MNKLILSIFPLLVFTACGNFLDMQPSVSTNTPIKEATHLLAIYDNPENVLSDNYFAFYATDDNELPKDMYAKYGNSFYMNTNIAPYCHYRDGIISNVKDAFWNGEYEKIYQANLIIENASSVTGSQEAINEALGCAYFMRAYSYFDLLIYYCLPWSEANKNALGLPLRLKLDFEEPVKRATLEKTYDQIFNDLQAAERYTTRESVDMDKPWRISKCAINAFYSRIYLARGEYEKALEYTEIALKNAPKLFDYNDFKWGKSDSYPAVGDYPAETVEYCETNDWDESRYLYFQEWIFPRLVKNPSKWDMPSTELIDLFDKDNDLRYSFFFVEHGNRSLNILYDWPSYSQFDQSYLAIGGLTTQELLLNKAEILARTNNWQDALSVLNPLRDARYKKGEVKYLEASNQNEALKVVLQERRRELPFTFRLGDIKRFSVNETPDDDVTIIRDFWDMTIVDVDTSSPKQWVIKGNSPCLAIPISQTEITSSKGQIEQNPGE